MTEYIRAVLRPNTEGRKTYEYIRKYICTIYLHVKAYYLSFEIDNYFIYLLMYI